MRRKIVMALSVFVLMFTACGKNNDSEPVTKQEETTNNNYKQMKDMFDVVKIGNKTTGFPFALKELSEEYTFELQESEDNSETFDIDLLKDGKHIWVDLYIYCDDTDRIKDTGIVYEINTYRIENIYEDADVTVGGIGIGSTLEEVIERFGEPSEDYDISEIEEYRKEETYRSLRYFGEHGEKIEFIADDGTKINCIFIESKKNK